MLTPTQSRDYRTQRAQGTPAQTALAIARILATRRASPFHMPSDGSEVTYKGFRFRVRIIYDAAQETPWDSCTPLGGVVKCRNESDRPHGWMWLIKPDRNGWGFAYDLRGAVREVRSWGKRYNATDADRLARQEAERFRAWLADDWAYIGIRLTLEVEDGSGMSGVIRREEYEASLWGIESDAGEYLAEVCEDLADEIITAIR